MSGHGGGAVEELHEVAEARKAYHDRLDEICSDVIRLAAMTTEQIGAATRSLLDGDLALVDSIYTAHEDIKAMTLDVETRTYQVIALQQPLASDLRVLLTVLRVLHEIELTAGLMKNVGRATRRLYPRDLSPRVRGIVERMGAQAAVQMQLAIDAFAGRDARVAGALPDMDDVMDDLQKELFRAIFAGGAPDEAALQQAVQTAFVGRDYERAADHAVTVGRWVTFMVTGLLPGEVAAAGAASLG